MCTILLPRSITAPAVFWHARTQWRRRSPSLLLIFLFSSLASLSFASFLSAPSRRHATTAHRLFLKARQKQSIDKIILSLFGGSQVPADCRIEEETQCCDVFSLLF